ncbi:UMP-CMP kinase [Chrysoperla carnea]|uniref:UMP-CMP kinase n=1 Tax=Chrysoperla carnea TaxID=189513 RepID=UPI001D08F3F0|nr:UMP-CMP kinase [Chrysoperla carnea]
MLSTIRTNKLLTTMLPKIVFVLGAPGSGKGTQCQNIVKEFGFDHLSAGDLLRAERQTPGSPDGELIEQHIKEGKIVPVEITCRLIEKAMNVSKNDKFLIDGFPRNEDNLIGWNKQMSEKVQLLFVLFFECDEKTCTERCLSRGAAGSGRSDDNIESLKKRFQTYQNDTLPIINLYDEQGLVKRIDANGSPSAVFDLVKVVFNDVLSKGDN